MKTRLFASGNKNVSAAAAVASEGSGAGAMPKEAPHSALSYSKWDHIDSEDEEDREQKKNGPLDPVLERSKTSTEREQDGKDAEKWLGMMEKYCGKYNEQAALPKQYWQLAANFIGVSGPGKEKTNVHRYNDIIKFATHYGDILLTPEIVDSLVELHYAIQAASKDLKNDNDPHRREMERLLHSINALEACRVNDKAIAAFYEMISQPSNGGRAYHLTKKYYEMEFGKHALMRHIFPKQLASGALRDFEQEYADLIVDGGAPPVGSSRRVEPEPSEFWKVDKDEMVILALLLGVLAIVFAGMFATVYWIDWENIEPPSFFGFNPFRGNRFSLFKGGSKLTSNDGLADDAPIPTYGKGEL